MSKRSDKTKCGPGEILRKGFTRKGFHRNEFTRKDGIVVPSTYIPETKVPPTCVPDLGKPGRGKKTLPPPDDILHLSSYGYSIHKPETVRRAALRAAAKDYDILLVLRRLNLLRNYQPIPENKEIFSKDVEFMKDMYDPYRKTKRAPAYDVWKDPDDLERWRNPNNRNLRNKQKNKTNSKSKSKSKSNKQKGGSPPMFFDPMTSDINETSETSDIVVNNVELPETRVVEVNTIIDRHKVCDQEGKCGVRNLVYEMHEVDGKQVLYYTIGEKDADEILELDKLYLDSKRDLESVLQTIRNNRGLLIGIKVDDKLQGYCQYEPRDNMEVKIVWFCANKGYGTPLYTFMEKYFMLNDYTRVILVVSLEGTYSVRRINFWNSMGFTTYETLPNDKKLHMEKYI
ncbi:putative N-acetyl transferase [Tupanvirus deep ocean]|uniref:N-acetyl transferase n=2 Tax=Tupanvirus TaxID=2094720 RepID=A0AC62A7B1_9VIRU|nr:putative N-acetyl transferase [Tupanvirus deep ocean]QKU33621.1 putative N-acetyl transferase [Tupanvirus deep ocean]